MIRTWLLSPGNSWVRCAAFTRCWLTQARRFEARSREIQQKYQLMRSRIVSLRKICWTFGGIARKRSPLGNWDGFKSDGTGHYLGPKKRSGLLRPGAPTAPRQMFTTVLFPECGPWCDRCRSGQSRKGIAVPVLRMPGSPGVPEIRWSPGNCPKVP